MFNYPLSSSSLRLLLSEVIDLRQIHFDAAREMVEQTIEKTVEKEDILWQKYLNALALFGFKEWVNKKMLDLPIHIENSSSFKTKYSEIDEAIFNVKIGEFKACIIAVEHLLDEIVFISQSLVKKIDLVSNFYVLVEVLEEEEKVIIRGFLPYEQLINYINLVKNPKSQSSGYEIPLSIFDTEPNHLLYYCSYLKPNSIKISEAFASPVSIELNNPVKETTSKLGKWLQNIFEENWYAIDILVSTEANLSFSTRNVIMAVRRGKLINLGMQLGNKNVALLVNITEEPEDKVGVLIQLHPTSGDRYLPSDITLKLLSKAGKTLQEVQARYQDNYIQLKPFKGESGKCFSIEVSILDMKICEHFEL